MKDETLEDLKETLHEKTMQIATDETKPAYVRAAALIANIGGKLLIHREEQKNLQNEFDKDFEEAKIVD